MNQTAQIIQFPQMAQPKFQPPTIGETLLHCAKIGLPEREGEKFLAYFDSVGWVVGKSKKPMVSWRGALATWKLNWQERGEINSTPSASILSIRNQEALKRVEARIQAIRGQFPIPAIDPRRTELSNLKTERNRLMKELGFLA